MRQIILDGREWKTELDLIEAVIAGLEGPSWHGRNYNALRDSMVTGDINGIEAPFELLIIPPANPPPEVTSGIDYFIERVTEWRAEGADIKATLAYS